MIYEKQLMVALAQHQYKKRKFFSILNTIKIEIMKKHSKRKKIQIFNVNNKTKKKTIGINDVNNIKSCSKHKTQKSKTRK